jgi:WD40 repeat protein
MTRQITCPVCAAAFTPADDVRGKKAVCPHCGERMVVNSAGVAKRDEGVAGPPPLPGRFPWLWLAALVVTLAAGGIGFGILLATRGPADTSEPPNQQDADDGPSGQNTQLGIIAPQKPKANTPRPTTQLLSTLELPVVDSICCLAFSRDGKTLAAGGARGIYVFDVASGKCKTTLKGPANEPLTAYSVAFSPTDNNLLASGCGFNTEYRTEYRVLMWDVTSGKNTANYDPGQLSGGWLPVAFSPDGKALVSGAVFVKLWDVATGKNTATLSEPRPLTTSLAFSPDGKTVAVASDRKKLIFWDVATRRTTTALEPADFGVLSLAFNKDGKTLALDTFTGYTSIRLWRVGDGKETRTVSQITRPGRGNFPSVFSPDGKLLAHLGDDNTVCLWDVAGEKGLTTVSKFTSTGPSSVAFSPDSKLLAWVGSEKAIKLCRIDSDAIAGPRLELQRATPR